MIRSQVYLSETERTQLNKLSRQTGKSQNELIREAIGRFIELHTSQSKDKLASVLLGKGVWSDRDDLPDFSSIRKELDRDT